MSFAGPRATISAALESAARTGSGITFVAEDGREETMSYDVLLDRARSRGGALSSRGLAPGDRVGIIEPDPALFLQAFLGAAWVGLVPVPLAPPLRMTELSAYVEQAITLVAAARVRALVVTSPLARMLGRVAAACPGLQTILSGAELVGPLANPVAGVDRADAAFVQYTSGSTSSPKGAVITHGNLAANIDAIGQGLGLQDGDKGASWLPLHHDMGLIGMALGSIYHGLPAVLMSPLVFLKRPASWLRMIARHRATVSFAPNFAYALCARRIASADLEGLDLSSWRVAGCGAEPVRAADLAGFAERFAPAGFDAGAFLPCYGMAEHTLAITFPPPGRGVRTSRAGHVSCGRPFAGHELAIVEELGGRRLPEGEVGEIVLRGPSLMSGYDVAGAACSGLEDGWLATGDLGYIEDGELHVCGRRKELIILNGRNVYPQDLERIAADVTGIRRGNVVAFQVPEDTTGGRQPAGAVVLLAEMRAGDAAEVARSLRARILDEAGVPLADVVLLPPGSLPKTSSGKLRRPLAAARYLEGALVTWRPPAPLAVAKERVASELGFLRASLGSRRRDAAAASQARS